MNRRDFFANKLLCIKKHAQEEFTFWMQKDNERISDIALLTEIKNRASYPSLRQKASGILDFIISHQKFVSELKEGDMVKAMQTFDKVPQGTICRYIGKLTPLLSIVEFDTNRKERENTLTLLLFPERFEKEPAKACEEPVSEKPTVSDSHLLVREMLLEPNPKIEEKYHIGRPVGSYGKKRREKDAQAITVIVPNQQKKRGRKLGSKNKPKIVANLQPVQEEIVEPVSIQPDQASVVLQLPPEPETVLEEPVVVQAEVVEPVKEPSKAIMVYQPNHLEETFLIRDHHAFEPGFLFVKKEEHGIRYIYVVRSAGNRIGEKRISMVCSKLSIDEQTWVDVKQFMIYEPPKLFIKPDDVYFYLTPNEYQLVYTTPCLVGLPMNIRSIEEVLDMNNLFQNRTVELLKQYASQHPGFSVQEEVLATFTKLAKHNMLNLRNFESIVQIVFNDDPREFETVFQQFTRFLGHEASRPNVQSIISAVVNEVRRKERIRQMKDHMSDLTNHLSDLPDDALQLLEERLRDVKKTS